MKHATVAGQSAHKGRFLPLAVFAAALLAACGDVTVDNVTAADAGRLLDPALVAQMLPPEARTIVTSYQGDLRNAAAAHLAEFGRLPASFADIASVAGARQAAVDAIADGLAGQVPFASRATLEQAAGGLVATAERQVLDRMKMQNASNP